MRSCLLIWILMGWSLQTASLLRFAEARDVLKRMYYRRRRPGSCYQGLVKASHRWVPGMLHDLWRRLCDKRLKRMVDAWSWYGWNVFTVDGSRFDAPRTHSNEQALGNGGDDKSGPQWRVTLLLHLPSCLLWNWRTSGIAAGERGHLREMLDTLPPKSLLVADAGFTGFDLMCDLVERRVSFLIRCGSNLRLLCEREPCVIKRCRDSDDVWLWPENRHVLLPLRLRLIVLKCGKQPMYLLTNEMESTRLPRHIAREFYAARWGVEIGYREIKQTFERRKLRSRAAAVGAAELAAVIVSWALLRLQACIVLGSHVTRLSMARALQLMRRTMEWIRYDRPTGRFFGEMQQALRDEYQRHRPKKARNWPHKKTVSPPGAPELRHMNQDDFERIDRLLAIESA